MSDIEKAIKTRVDEFVAELTELIRKSALSRLSEALGGEAAASEGGGRKRRGAGASKSAKRSKGQKRSPEQMEALAKSILKLVSAKPGIRADQIAEELAIETRDTSLPIKKLLAEKTISKKGQKRATAYFPKNK